MKPTRIWVLAGLAVLAAGLAYAFTRSYYASLQSPSIFAPLSLLLLALAEAYTASMTHARLSGRPGTRPIDPLVVARLAALAKATSPVGALAAGGYVGFLIHVARTSSEAARRDTRTAAVGVGCSVGLVVAALVLERVCRAKHRQDDEEDER